MASKGHQPWDNKLEMVFLKQYFAENILWDTSNRYYKDRIQNNAAWDRISKSMSIEVEELKRKKDSLLSSYRLYRNKVKKSMLKRGNEVYKPIWFAYSYMDSFLSKGPNEVKTIESEDTASDSEDPLSPEDDKRNLQYLVPVSKERLMGTPARKRRRSSPEPFQDSLFEESLASINKAITRRKSSQDEDDCDRYGKILANKLRKLSGDERLIFMHEIDGLFIKRIQNRLKSSPLVS